MKWKDDTSYSREDKERVPKTWTLDLGEVRITVTCGHIYHRGEWVMHCRPWFDTHALNMLENVNAEEAQAKALAKVRTKVDAIHAAIHAVG